MCVDELPGRFAGPERQLPRAEPALLRSGAGRHDDVPGTPGSHGALCPGVADEAIVAALRRELKWTHIMTLIYMDDPLKRDFCIEPGLCSRAFQSIRACLRTTCSHRQARRLHRP